MPACVTQSGRRGQKDPILVGKILKTFVACAVVLSRQKLLMKKLAALFILSLPCLFGVSQIVDLQENVSYQNNGLEYGYYITNERSKEVKGDDYERYEINFYVTNKSGCIKLIPLKAASGNKTSDDDVVLAEFNCKNATGKRLTAKSGKVGAQPWHTQVRVYDESTSKYRLINAQVGYAIRNGQTYSNRVIVIVPKGERPRITVRAVYFPEI